MRKVCRIRQFDDDVRSGLVSRNSVFIDDQERVPGKVSCCRREQNCVRCGNAQGYLGWNAIFDQKRQHSLTNTQPQRFIG